MTRLYQLMTEPQFSRCSKPAKYKKLLFALCFFHSVLLERKKFLQLGWNIIYGFNDSDFEVCSNPLSQPSLPILLASWLPCRKIHLPKVCVKASLKNYQKKKKKGALLEEFLQ